jgi:hypothetical protein
LAIHLNLAAICSKKQDHLWQRRRFRSNRPKLICPDGHSGLRSHDLHKDPDPPVGRDLFHLCHEINKGTQGKMVSLNIPMP